MKKILLFVFCLFILCSSNNSAFAELAQAEKKFLDATKRDFMQTYRAVWDSMKMGDKLSEAINQTVKEQTSGWIPSGLQLTLNLDDVIEKINESALARFGVDYENFLSKVENDFNELYRENVINAYRAEVAIAMPTIANIMGKAYLRQIIGESLRENANSLFGKINAELEKKYPGIGFSTGKIIVGVAATAITTKLYGSIVRKFGMRSLSKALGSKLSAKAIPIVGYLMIVWGAYDVVSVVFSGVDELKNILNTKFATYMKEELPIDYWESSISVYAIEGYSRSVANAKKDIAKAESFIGKPEVKRLTQDMNEEQAAEFSVRLAALERELSTDVDSLLKDFGEVLKRVANPTNFERFLEMLRGNKQQVKEWFGVAGDSLYYDMYAQFPKEIWDKYPPNKDSLEILDWMARKLPRNAINVATHLEPSDINWLMREFPERYLPNLFAGDKGIPQIRDEILRLKDIPEKEYRKPWQTYWEALWAQVRYYIVWGAFTLIGLVLLIIIRKIIRKSKPTKNEAIVFDAQTKNKIEGKESNE